MRIIARRARAIHRSWRNRTGLLSIIPSSLASTRRTACAALLISVMVLLQLGLAALTPWDIEVAYSAPLAMSTLLALWTVFGPEPIAVRLPLTLFLAVASCLAVLYGEWRADGPVECAPLYLADWLLACVITQLPLWVLRAVRGWRLAILPGGGDATASSTPGRHADAKATTQFSMRYLLGWTMATAALLGVFRMLEPDLAFNAHGLLEALPIAGLQGLLFAVAGLHVIVVAWIVLAAGRRLMLRSVLFVLLLVGLPCGILVYVHFNVSSTGFEMALFEAGPIANGAACLAVIAACGYRLERRSCLRGGDVRQTGIVSWMSPLSRRQLAIAGIPLLVIAAAVASVAPRRLQQWHQHDVEVEWERRGFEVRFDEDGSVSMYYTSMARRSQMMHWNISHRSRAGNILSYGDRPLAIRSLRLSLRCPIFACCRCATAR